MAYLLIDPQERLDYACDWSAFLAEGGSPPDTIATSTWSIAPQDGSPPAPALSGALVVAATAAVFVSGAQAGEIYRLSNRIVTAQGRTAERSIVLRCGNR